MYVHMKLNDVELKHTLDHSKDASQRASFHTWLTGTLSLGLGLVLAIVGLMMGLTLMLVALGLLPIALAWLWFMNRRSPVTVGTEATESGMPSEHDRSPADRVKDGRAALAAALDEVHALVLLDLGLPRQDGLSVLKALRQKRASISVIIITARDGVDERIAGLDLGADDDRVKPFPVD